MVHAPVSCSEHVRSALCPGPKNEGSSLFPDQTSSKSFKTDFVSFVRARHPRMFSTTLYEFVEDEQLYKSMGDKEEMDLNEHMNFISHVCVASVKQPPLISKTHQTC